MSPVGRLVPKTLRSTLGLQNFWFLVNIKGASIKTNQKNVANYRKKRLSQKNWIVLKPEPHVR